MHIPQFLYIFIPAFSIEIVDENSNSPRDDVYYVALPAKLGSGG